MSDEEYFGAATREFSLGAVDKNLFAKARVLAGGDEKSAEFEYIKLRVEQLKSEKRNHALRAVTSSAGMKISSSGSALWSNFSRYSRNQVIGVLAFCVAGALAAFLLSNEINGTCAKFRLAKINHQDWMIWLAEQGIDPHDLLTASSGYLERKYGQEAVDRQSSFTISAQNLRAAKYNLNPPGFCFEQGSIRISYAHCLTGRIPAAAASTARGVGCLGRTAR